VPTLFGMNFQAVSVGQKLPKAGPGDDPGMLGGYADASAKPNSGLAAQLAYVDGALGELVAGLKANNLYNSTLIIIASKHGQAPIDPATFQALDDDPYTKTPGYGFHIADDASLIWLDPAQRTAANLAKTVTDLNANAVALGIQAVVGPDELKHFYQDPATDSRTPDFFVISQHGVVYTGGTKLAEHGGVASDDRHVAMLVSGPGMTGQLVTQTVFTTQIAPTILGVFGISPTELQAVQLEGTRQLPGLPY